MDRATKILKLMRRGGVSTSDVMEMYGISTTTAQKELRRAKSMITIDERIVETRESKGGIRVYKAVQELPYKRLTRWFLSERFSDGRV